MLRSVSDTALWVATYRAIETARADALFHDPYAERLAGERGRAIVGDIPNGVTMAWSMSVRTAVIDDMLRGAVAAGTGTVVNLGAGLDTRAFRLDLPPALHWFDVDLPEIIAHRERGLDGIAARCRHVHLEADLADADALERVMRSVDASEGPILVLTEGLLIYWTPEAVNELARRLQRAPRVQGWVTDVVSPRLLASVASQWDSHLAKAGASFRFAPEDSRTFFGLAGWQEEGFRSLYTEAVRLRRPPPPSTLWSPTATTWWLSSPEQRHRLSGVALLAPRAEHAREAVAVGAERVACA